MYGLAGSELIHAGKNLGLKTANEVFADRTYSPQGFLTPRSQPGALITDPEASLTQVICMIENHFVISSGNTKIAVEPDTICIHGDHPNSLEFAKAIYQGLSKANVTIKSMNFGT